MSSKDYEKGWKAGWDFAVEFFTQTPVIGRPERAPWTCATPGCPGDGRYAAPGRGHVAGCRFPLHELTDPPRCPKCGHAPHGRYCLNMASDNDCSCRYVSIEVEGTGSTDPGPVVYDPPLTQAEGDAYWDAISDDTKPHVSEPFPYLDSLMSPEPTVSHTYDGHRPICAGSCGFNPEPTEPSLDDRIKADIDAGNLPREWLADEPTEPEPPADVEIRSK